MSGPRPGSFAVGARPRASDPPCLVPIGAARCRVLLERVLHRDGQLGVRARHRALAARLEAVARALLRHQEVRHAQEAALEPSLEGAQRPLADREATYRELLAERRVAQDDRPLAHHRGELREEEARVAPGAAARRDGVRLGEGQRLVAEKGVHGGAGHAGGAAPRRLRDRRQRRACRPKREAEDGDDLDHVLGGGGDRQALHVHQAVRGRQLLEEAKGLLVAAEGGEVEHHLAARPRLDRGPGLDLDPGEARGLGELPHDQHVRRGGGAVREDAAQGLQATIEQEPLLGEGAGGLHGQQRREEGEEHGVSAGSAARPRRGEAA